MFWCIKDNFIYIHCMEVPKKNPNGRGFDAFLFYEYCLDLSWRSIHQMIKKELISMWLDGPSGTAYTYMPALRYKKDELKKQS